MGDETSKVELFASGSFIEIRYFDTPKDERYRSWKLPLLIADDLIAWWQKTRKQKSVSFPLKTRTKVCELTMNTEKYVEIKSLDCQGRTNMTGWSLPDVVVEKLIIWSAKAK